MSLPNLYNQSDPAAPEGDYIWHFVYLHGEAEALNQEMADKGGWHEDERHWSPSDCFVSDQPMPPDGDYDALLYGRPVKVVIRKRKHANYLCGRVACIDDPEGLAHALSPDDWR